MERQVAGTLVATVITLLVAGCAGAGTRGSERIAHAPVARTSAPCKAGQLALSYRGGEPATGNDFGTLLVRDRSGRACTLPGQLRVTGLNAAGRPVTNTVRFRLDRVHSGELVGELGLQAEYRDGPATVDNGFCMPLWVIPAIWRVRLPDGHAITVPNADPSNSFKLAPSGGLVTCRGKLARQATGPGSST